MIEVKTKVHDQYSIEFKMGFVTDGQESDFTVGMWIFVPGSLDITPATFTKAEFYRCVKSNVRLITPRFRLGEIARGPAYPLNSVRNASPEDYDYQLKLFCAIVKSAIRDERELILKALGGSGSVISGKSGSVESGPEEYGEISPVTLAKRYASDVRTILDEFWKLPDNSCHRYCGEFLCNIICSDTLSLPIETLCKDDFLALLNHVQDIRMKHGYATVNPDDKAGNKNFVHRRGVLKKFVESHLYLRVPKKRDGFVMEQALFSVAAGLAMLFATVVAWAFQRHFGNLTWPLFIALIISYMMKDRIKELMRYYFAHRISDKHFDNKARIGLHSRIIGSLKEGMDFIRYGKVPDDVRQLRNRSHICEAEDEFIDENVILYRKRVHLDLAKMQSCSNYKLEGINDIIRFQVRPFLRKMDNPEVFVNRIDGNGKVISVPCSKDYFVNVILQYRYGDTTECKRYRLDINRNGIQSMEEVR